MKWVSTGKKVIPICFPQARESTEEHGLLTLIEVVCLSIHVFPAVPEGVGLDMRNDLPTKSLQKAPMLRHIKQVRCCGEEGYRTPSLSTFSYNMKN